MARPRDYKTYPLDPTTGLPVLPEGLWWEVLENPAWHEWDVSTYSVGIKHIEVIEEHLEEDLSWLGRVFGRLIVVPESTREAWVLSQFVLDESEDSKKATYVCTANILLTAYRVMGLFEAKEEGKRRTKQSAALVGAYPPKSMNEVDTDVS